MTAVVFFSLLLIVIGVVLVLPIVLICVLLANRRSPPPAPVAPPSLPINPDGRNQRREAILERLAAKEISREEAEQQLLELDNPVPAQMPALPKSSNGCGSGCLVAFLCAILALAIFIVLLGTFFGVRTSVMHREHMIRIEEIR